MLRKTQKQIAPCGASIKSMIEDYLKYLKDNPNHYWFKRRLYGWGWTPATWQGWLSVFVFFGFILWNARCLGFSEQNTVDFWWFFGKEFVLLVIFIFILYKKGESPKWQWGIPKEEKEPK